MLDLSTNEIMGLIQIKKTKTLVNKASLAIGRTGIFYLNREAIKIILYTDGMREVDLYQNDEEPDIFYLQVSFEGTCKITPKKMGRGPTRPATLAATFIFAEGGRVVRGHFNHNSKTKLIMRVKERVKFDNKWYVPLIVVQSSIVARVHSQHKPYVFHKITE